MKSTTILFRLSQEEKKQLQDFAKSNHLTMSSYIRMKTLTTNNK
jgi:hypothetical protein